MGILETIFGKRQKKHRKKRFLITHFYMHTLKKDFKKAMGYYPDVDHPKTFNEKIQWLKCYYRDPIQTQCADKVAVRDIVKKLAGEKYLIPQYGVWKRVEDMDFDSFPKEFVLKTNHTSSKVIICRDKDHFDKKDACEKLNTWLGENYYYMAGEWVYKDIPPKILCEKFLHGEMTDYKFFCYHGEVKLCNVITERKNGHYKEMFVKPDFTRLPFMQDHRIGKPIDPGFPKPPHWEEMVEVARKLCKRFPFVRVDLYDLEGQVWFGELTFFPANGMDTFEPEEWDKKLGDLLHLDKLDPKYVIKK